MQLVNNVGDAVQNGVFRKHSERIVPAHVLLELGLLEEVPGGDARSPHHRGVDVVVKCLGGGEGEGVKGGWPTPDGVSGVLCFGVSAFADGVVFRCFCVSAQLSVSVFLCFCVSARRRRKKIVDI